eukprot:Hpha_TRINITY_DN15557_c3_g5::TRINITY_DN15557_c3_g5_i1::g.104718::m.104718/K04043/dnaK, HSPA9; molecular chaperone DnaK
MASGGGNAHVPPFTTAHPVLGLDIGDTTVNAAFWSRAGGAVEVLINAQGEKQTPACAHLSPQDQWQLGEFALRRNKGARVERLRNFVGLHHGELSPRSAEARPELRAGEVGEPLMVHLSAPDGSSLPPQPTDALYKLFSSAVKRRAEAVTSLDCHQVVVGVPPHAPLARQRQIIAACTAAGFGNISLLPEPIASVLAARPATALRVGVTAVVDVGGRSVVCSLVELSSDGSMHVAGVAGDCSGQGVASLDDVLLSDVAAQWESAAGMAMRPSTKEQLRRQAEQVKIAAGVQLSRPALRSAELPGMYIDIDDAPEVEWTLDPAKLGEFSKPVADAAVSAVRRSLAAARMVADGVGEILFVGGGGGLPAVVEGVRGVLPSAAVLNISEGVAQDETVAVGCALYGSMLAQCGYAPPDTFLSVWLPPAKPAWGCCVALNAEGGLQHAVGILVRDGAADALSICFPAGSSLPARASRRFDLPSGGATAALGVAELVGDEDAQVLGEVSVAAEGSGALEVLLSIDAEGKVEVRSRDDAGHETIGVLMVSGEGAVADPHADWEALACLLAELEHRASALGWFVEVPALRAAYEVGDPLRERSRRAVEAANAVADSVASAPGDDAVTVVQRGLEELRIAAGDVQRPGDTTRPLGDVAYVTWQRATAPRQDDPESLISACRQDLPLDAPVSRASDTVLHAIGKHGAPRCLAALTSVVPAAKLAAAARIKNSDGLTPAELAATQGHSLVAEDLRRMATTE